jgi:alpha-1,3-glucosyltransferase
MTSGLVGEMGHQVLPSISPLMTMILTLLAMCPSLVKLWFKPSVPVDFLKTIVCCGYGSFLFGWHVHEKAVMMITLPMCLLALGDKKFMRIYLLLSFAGHISLFPLLYTSAETLIKITIFIIYSTSSLLLLPLSFKGARRSSSSILSVTGLTSIDILMIIMFLIVPQIYCTALHGLFGFMLSYPFIPLLITSVSCAIVVLWTWILTLSTL